MTAKKAFMIYQYIDPLCQTPRLEFAQYLQMTFFAKTCQLHLFYKLRGAPSPTQATVTNTLANYRAHNFGLMAKLSRKGKRWICKSCFY